jgi:hypothetical protein
VPVIGGHLPDEPVPGDQAVPIPAAPARQGRVCDGRRGEIGRGGGGGRDNMDRLHHDLVLVKHWDALM